MAQQGYTLYEWEEMDRQRAMRRSFFQKSRRLERELRLDRFWPLLKRLRLLVSEELAGAGAPPDEESLDRHLEAKLPEVLAHLQQLLAKDRKSRAARVLIAQGGP